jgi:hypothetical protein
VYGMWKRRVSIATNAETNRSKPSCDRPNVMAMLLNSGAGSPARQQSTSDPARLVLW